MKSQPDSPARKQAPVATTCTAGGGMYLARTAADLEPYLAQLASRHQGLGRRVKLVRACHRRLSAQEAARRTPPRDRDGQLVIPALATGSGTGFADVR